MAASLAGTSVAPTIVGRFLHENGRSSLPRRSTIGSYLIRGGLGVLILHHRGTSNQILDRMIRIIRLNLKENRTEVAIRDSTIGGRGARAVSSAIGVAVPRILQVRELTPDVATGRQ